MVKVQLKSKIAYAILALMILPMGNYSVAMEGKQGTFTPRCFGKTFEKKETKLFMLTCLYVGNIVLNMYQNKITLENFLAISSIYLMAVMCSLDKFFAVE